MIQWLISGAAGLSRAAASISGRAFRGGMNAASAAGRRFRRFRLRRKAGRRMAARTKSNFRMQDAYRKFGGSRQKRLSRAAATVSGRTVNQSGFFNQSVSTRSNPTNLNLQNAASQANANYARSQNERASASERAASTMYSLANAAAVVTVGFLKIPVAVAVLLRGIHAWSNALIDQQRGTAQYSGQMSASVAMLDVHRVLREMKQARSTQESFSQLTRAVDRLENALAPSRSIFTNVMNYAGAAAANAGSNFMSWLTSQQNANLLNKIGMQLAIPGLGVMVSAMRPGSQQSVDNMGPMIQMGQLRDQQRAFYQANQGAPGIPRRPKKAAVTSGGGGVTNHGN